MPRATRLTARYRAPCWSADNPCCWKVQNLLKTKLLVQATQKAAMAATT